MEIKNNVRAIKEKYDNLKEFLKEDYSLQMKIMGKVEGMAFKKDINPFEYKKFWLLKTAALIYNRENVRKILQNYGYKMREIKIIEDTIKNARNQKPKKDIEKILYDGIYLNESTQF